MSSLIKRPSGIYYLVFWNEGKQHWVSLKTRDRVVAEGRSTDLENRDSWPSIGMAKRKVKLSKAQLIENRREQQREYRRRRYAAEKEAPKEKCSECGKRPRLAGRIICSKCYYARYQEQCRDRQAGRTERLTDGYIRKLLAGGRTKDERMPAALIPQSEVDAHRELLRLKRAVHLHHTLTDERIQDATDNSQRTHDRSRSQG